MTEISAHISEKKHINGHIRNTPETVFFQPKLSFNESKDIKGMDSNFLAERLLFNNPVIKNETFFKPTGSGERIIQRKDSDIEPEKINTDKTSKDKGGNKSKYSEKEIKSAILELERSQLFKDLQTDPQIDSLSKRDYYKKNIERIENAIKLELGGDPSKIETAEQSVLKFELEFSTFKSNSSNELRILSFEEWDGGVAAAKAFDDENRIELRGKDKTEKSSLRHTLAHEYSHLFDPEMNDESVALSEFKDSRSELFAEIFSQLILCEVSGSTGCRILELKYGTEEMELEEDTSSGIDIIYRSGITSKEKADQINILVKQIINENSETDETQIP